MSFVNTVVDRTFSRTYLYAYIFARLNHCEPDRIAIESILPDLHRQVTVLDAAVKETGFLAGDRFSFAD